MSTPPHPLDQTNKKRIKKNGRTDGWTDGRSPLQLPADSLLLSLLHDDDDDVTIEYYPTTTDDVFIIAARVNQNQVEFD